MPVKRTHFKIFDIITKKISSGSPTYLIKTTDGIGQYYLKWISAHEIPPSDKKLIAFEKELKDLNVAMRNKRMQQREAIKKRIDGQKKSQKSSKKSVSATVFITYF